jgi:hypothetical protein
MIVTSWQHRARACGLFFFLALLLAAPACSDDGGQPQEPPFFDIATVKSWPEVRNCRFSIEHNGVYIQVFASPGDETAYTSGMYPLPEGTVLVKAEHDDDACTELLQYTAMRKLAAGAATGDGDWEWQSVDGSGRVLESGSLPECVSCHRSCTEGRDFTCTDP